ncbi:MAG TPA: class I SAM-dependent methyltransferase [Thermomicrobiaceae bacterium]|nr:class I SAM-dependent methyltransferase [Thermomicrobiaceae bacterium]
MGTEPQKWPNALLEEVACPLCGPSRTRTLFVARDRLLGGPGAFPVTRCLCCGMVYLNPRPTAGALGAYYPDVYYPLKEEPDPTALAIARGLCTRVAGWVERADASNPSVLDIGCGTGLFLREARERGWTVEGIELSASAAAYARERFGLPVRQGTLAQTTLPNGAFDVITMWHVLEHLPDPLATLRQVQGALRPGGLLLLAVPNVASLEARLFGRRWYSLDAPRHLYHFSPATVEAALRRAGLRPERIVHSAGTAGLVYSLMGDLTGVSLKLRRRPLSAPAYRRAARALSLPAAPLCALAARAGRGGALEIYAINPD